ncbi:hypothetical protein [Oscillatoria sp. FACHB-1407]|uniref:hypothetical protein n=1 Tax=Oscillatoria sp. FACHB-1407 TaxID=2692847 RepID=UPI0030D8F99D
MNLRLLTPSPPSQTTERQFGLGAWRINSRLSEPSPPTRTLEGAGFNQLTQMIVLL